MDDDACYRALTARDARFDGVFFFGVTTTGIYCRPICPAKTPGRKNCRYFASAAQAEQAGFRRCLRCRPELAPSYAPVDNMFHEERPTRTTTTCYSWFESPLGPLWVQGDGQAVTGLFLSEHKGWTGPDATLDRRDEPFAAVRAQLAEYFAGQRQQFDVPLHLAGTSFQQRVWQQLLQIPFGRTITYLELARRIGNPAASRAVGHANGRNPISILVPCHRVIGATGKLTGYAGGLEKKQWLLAWERQVMGSVSGGSLITDVPPQERASGQETPACMTVAHRPRRAKWRATFP